MFTFYLISIAVYALAFILLGRLQVREGGTITIEEMFWFTVGCFVPIVNSVVALIGVVCLFDHYKDRPVFGGKK